MKQISQRKRQLFVCLLSAALALLVNKNGRGEVVVFELNSCLSSVDLTAFGYVDNPFYFTAPTSTRDTQTIPLEGSITLDVDVAAGTVQSVDFVSLEFNYLAELENPVIHKRITLYDSSEGIPKGTEIEVHLPFDEDQAAGNPVPRYAPTLTLNGSGGGTETGTGGDLVLTGSDFQFVGTGQYFNLPPGRDSVFVDGWPMDYGPYPTATPFPSMMPGTEYIPGDPPNTAMSPSPTGPNYLDGTISVLGDNLVFNGSLLSLGVGGAGILQTAQIHEASILASTAPNDPGDFDFDGDADGFDFLLWQRNPCVGDFAEWETNFGSGAMGLVADTSSRPLPEPSTLILLGVGGFLVIARRKRTVYS